MKQLIETLFKFEVEELTIDGVEYLGYSQSVPDVTGKPDNE